MLLDQTDHRSDGIHEERQFFSTSFHLSSATLVSTRVPPRHCKSVVRLVASSGSFQNSCFNVLAQRASLNQKMQN